MKGTLEKITAWLCWSIFMTGMGYAWCYYHFVILASVKGVAL